jgi:hypothetical protein
MSNPRTFVHNNQVHSPSPLAPDRKHDEWIEMLPVLVAANCTVTATAVDGIPFATTSSILAPVSIPAGTSKLVETVALPVARSGRVRQQLQLMDIMVSISQWKLRHLN